MLEMVSKLLFGNSKEKEAAFLKREYRLQKALAKQRAEDATILPSKLQMEHQMEQTSNWLNSAFADVRAALSNMEDALRQATTKKSTNARDLLASDLEAARRWVETESSFTSSAITATLSAGAAAIFGGALGLAVLPITGAAALAGGVGALVAKGAGTLYSEYRLEELLYLHSVLKQQEALLAARQNDNGL